MSVYGVTGGQGFIGSYVRRELLARGHQVVVFDRHPHTEMAAGETFVLAAIPDETAVEEPAAHVEGTLHLAAARSTTDVSSRSSVRRRRSGTRGRRRRRTSAAA